MKLAKSGREDPDLIFSFCLILILRELHSAVIIKGVFFTGTPLKVTSTEKLIYARLGVSRPIYVNVDSPNRGFPYFNF